MITFVSHKDEQDTDDTPRAEDGATADPETPTMASLPSPLTEADYAAIEAAVMETARGRWFLGEYARRNRNSDTAEVLDAIERLERIVGERRAAEVVDADRLRLDLIDMAAAITRTREEIAAMSSDPRTDSRIGAATESLDAVVEATETATSEILSAAETVQEVAWTLREQGVDTEACDKLDANAVEIYTLCSFQDLTGQRIQKVVQTLRYLEQRIDAMMRIWHVGDDDRPAARPESEPDADARLLNGPALPGEGIDQSSRGAA